MTFPDMLVLVEQSPSVAQVWELKSLHGPPPCWILAVAAFRFVT